MRGRQTLRAGDEARVTDTGATVKLMDRQIRHDAYGHAWDANAYAIWLVEQANGQRSWVRESLLEAVGHEKPLDRQTPAELRGTAMRLGKAFRTPRTAADRRLIVAWIEEARAAKEVGK